MAPPLRRFEAVDERRKRRVSAGRQVSADDRAGSKRSARAAGSGRAGTREIISRFTPRSRGKAAAVGRLGGFPDVPAGPLEFARAIVILHSARVRLERVRDIFLVSLLELLFQSLLRLPWRRGPLGGFLSGPWLLLQNGKSIRSPEPGAGEKTSPQTGLPEELRKPPSKRSSLNNPSLGGICPRRRSPFAQLRGFGRENRDYVHRRRRMV